MQKLNNMLSTSELVCFKQLLQSFEVDLQFVIVVCDSKSDIRLDSNLLSHDKSKHNDIICHFIRQHVKYIFLKLVHIKKFLQLVDPLTKSYLIVI